MPEYNLEIIGLNSQACNDENWFLFKDTADPGQTLDWLRKELYESEVKNENVYILSHFPSRSFLETWSRVYSAIVEIYSHIIRGQFIGHAHGDSLQVFRDLDTGNINNAGYTPASLTTYSKRNPSFRVYHLDAEALALLTLNSTDWTS